MQQELFVCEKSALLFATSLHESGERVRMFRPTTDWVFNSHDEYPITGIVVGVKWGRRIRNPQTPSDWN